MCAHHAHAHPAVLHVSPNLHRLWEQLRMLLSPGDFIRSKVSGRVAIRPHRPRSELRDPHFAAVIEQIAENL